MPLYEFDCEECHQPFDKFVRSINAVNEASCPTCGSDRVTKKISSFAARLSSDRSYSYASSSAASCSPAGT
jgi:putative FmdB family regulatory protein